MMIMRYFFPMPAGSAIGSTGLRGMTSMLRVWPYRCLIICKRENPSFPAGSGWKAKLCTIKIWQDHIRIDFFNAINDSLHIIDGNTLPLKGNCAHISPFQARELTSQERVFLLRLIVYEFVRRRPSNPVAGITLDEALALLYARLAIPAALGRE
ncbi:hypothetical protein [Raoultella planticola]|uniref:hypothetical protein n=1 Tax=Raoultella planticola TaxID=575 RepID=UPI0014170208|nr:hypothetical protein [Raoultella planticola]